jgi:hypothetical protein
MPCGEHSVKDSHSELLVASKRLLNRMDELAEEVSHHVRPLAEIQAEETRIEREWVRIDRALTAAVI